MNLAHDNTQQQTRTNKLARVTLLYYAGYTGME